MRAGLRILPLLMNSEKVVKEDGTVKSSRCKARETGDPPKGWGVQAKRGQS
jgi:hypothetical protein